MSRKKNALKRISATSLVKTAIAEDVGSGDITSNAVIVPAHSVKSVIVAKQDGVICGMSVARQVFRFLNRRIKFTAKVREGQKIRSGQVLAEISGNGQAILSGERTALNFLQKLSGISTMTRKYVDLIRGTGAKILDTRKTTPGWRALEKYAVKTGGGYNHRFGLFDAVLIKSNHLKMVKGSILTAVERIRKKYGQNVRIETEAKDLSDVRKSLGAGVQRIMLDNMKLSGIKKAVALIRKNSGKTKIEASGRVNLGNVLTIARTGVDFISIGSLTHSAPALDMALTVLRRTAR